MDQESDFLPNKCGRRVVGGIDRISQLPDEIIVVILSFLMLREAAATSVLSSRWLDLWKHIPYLNLDKFILSPRYHFCHREEDNFSLEAKRCKYIVTVNSLSSHTALSLKKFRISLRVKRSDKCTVTKWLKFVLSRHVESLELDFERCYKDSDVVVLEELLREESIISRAPETLIFFQSLKRLCLKRLKVSGEDIELFVQNCPLLEQLRIHYLTLTSDVEICGAKLILKRLSIGCCKGNKTIKVSAPNLTGITSDSFTAGMLSFENVPKLVEAGLVLVGSLPSAASCYISKLQTLKLLLLNPKEFWKSEFAKIPNLKKLTIDNDQMYKHSLLPVTALIWAYPRLEEFKLKFFGELEDTSEWMGAITNVERSPHQHLKVFAFQMSSRQYTGISDRVVELVTYILDNSVALQKIIIGSPLYDVHANRITDLITAEMQADVDNLTQQLQAKVPNHIQLGFTYAT